LSFGRKAMKKTLAQLKARSIAELAHLIAEIQRNTDKINKIGGKLGKLHSKGANEKVGLLSSTVKEYGTIAIAQNDKFVSALGSLMHYVSALENYALEFDKTWDDLLKQTEKMTQQIGETTARVANKQLDYIK